MTLRIVPENHLDLWNIQVHSKIEKIAETECAKDSKETESAAKFAAAIQVETGQSSAVQGIMCPITQDSKQSVFIAEGANGMLTFYIKDAKLWSAENPNLYRLTVSTESDSVSLVIGLREVIFDTKKAIFHSTSV